MRAGGGERIVLGMTTRETNGPNRFVRIPVIEFTNLLLLCTLQEF